MGNKKHNKPKGKSSNKAQQAGPRRSEPKSPITKESSDNPPTLEMVSNPPVSSEQANEISEEPVVVVSAPVETVVDKVDETIALVTPEKLEKESAVVVDNDKEPTEPAEAVVNEEPKIVVEEEPKKEETEKEDGQTEEKVEEKVKEKVVELMEKVVELEEKVHDEKKDEENNDKKEELEEEAGSQTEEDGGRKRRDSSQTDTTMQTDEPEVFTDYTWEKTDDDINIKQAIFIKSYKHKFSVFLRVIDPEFRFVAGIGPSAKLDPEENVLVFDPEGISEIFEKMKKQGFKNPCPFQNENFKATFEEIRQFLSEVLTQIKFCLRLACAERGYEYKSGKFTNQPISSVWGDELDPMLELKTIKGIMDEVKEPITKMLTEGQETRFWAELKTIYEEVVPALEIFDSKTLADNNISDCMATIHGRQELGFAITEEEVDHMLEQSFTEDGFGEFPSTALYAPALFTSTKQLKLIYVQLEKMSKVTDIRVKLAGIQTITRIIQLIDDDEVMSIMEEFEDHPKLPVEKMFGLNPLEFSVTRYEQPKRTQYMKIFHTALGETNPKEDFEMTLHQLASILKCFYMVFSAFEINMILFKILGTHIKDCSSIDADRKHLVRALFSLPEPLKKRLEIGPDYERGEITDDMNSMYYQVKNFIRIAKKDLIGLLICFLHCGDGSRRLINAERVMRQAMLFIESCTAQAMAVETLKILQRNSMSDLSFSKEFFEDLIVLALSKYSVPEEKTNEKKYEFITTVFDIINEYKENHVLEIDSKKVAEKWTDMGHPWFSVLFLSHRFPILKDSIPAASHPWRSADVWTDDEKNQNDLKNYIHLAKVPTAWPNCIKITSVMALVDEHVPLNINRRELYTHMIDYIRICLMSEFQKKGLLNALIDKVASLTPSTTTKKTKDHSSEKKSEKSKDKNKKAPVEKLDIKKADEKLVTQAKETQTSPMPQVEKLEKPTEAIDVKVSDDEKKVEEPVVIDLVEEDSEDVKEEKQEKNQEEEETEEQKWEIVQMSEVEKEEENPIPEENPEKLDTPKPEKEVTVEAVDTTVKVVEPETPDTRKPLKELDTGAFYGWYEPAEWEVLTEKVITEIYRQREMHGFSNKL